MENEIMQKEIMNVEPEVCSYVDDESSKMHLEIALPGVKKESINLRLREDELYLSAVRNDKDVEYVTNMSLCCPVDAKKAQAKYEDGLLKIEVPFKDSMADAIKIEVN